MVKCAECGYLGVRHPHTYELVTPDERQRETGIPTGIFTVGDKTTILGDMPICAVGACDLRKECEQTRKVASELGKVPCEVTHKDRECSQFTDLIPGLTPKEHIEMNLLQEQRIWQQTNQAANDRRQQSDSARNFRVNFLLVLVSIAAAIASWWVALHPGIVVVQSTPAATAPAIPFRAHAAPSGRL